MYAKSDDTHYRHMPLTLINNKYGTSTTTTITAIASLLFILYLVSHRDLLELILEEGDPTQQEL